MLDEQQWGLAILVSQKLAWALPKPTWRVVLGGDPWKSSKGTHCLTPTIRFPWSNLMSCFVPCIPTYSS
jgi:hypothetical protein